MDLEEYIYLAIHASAAGDHHAALEYLYKALALSPDHAQARYLLAAEHAELGLYDRASNELEELLKIAPEMETARFQLGLLTLQLGRQEEARAAFSKLSEGASDESLKAFSQAYLHMLNDDVGQAVTQLTYGIESCANVSLQHDMQQVLSALSGANTTAENGEVPSDHGSAVFLGAYRNPLEVP